MKKNKKILLFVLLFANIVSTSVVNICIPGLPLLADDFNVSAFVAQGTIGVHMFGSFLGRVFWGPLSDAYGRRFILVRVLAISVFGLMGCCLSTNIYALFFFRLIQAIGSGVVLIISMVIMTDISTGAKRARNLSFIETSWPISWIFAPIIGSFLCSMGGWRISFAFLAIMQTISLLTIYFCVQETLVKRTAQWSVSKGLYCYKLLITNVPFIVYAFMPGLIVSGYMLFAVSSPFLYTIDFLFTIQEFAFVQALPLLVSFCMTLTYRALIKRFNEKIGLYLGIGFYAVFALLNVVMLAGVFTITPRALLLAMCVQCLGSACLIPASCSMALSYAPKNTSGAAASVISSTRNLVLSICLTIGGMIYSNGNPKYLVLGISVTVLATFVLYIIQATATKANLSESLIKK
ncbi:MAG: MFS transporter [Holosporales bacterium]|jgi:DHA1 family bicyclomycin/chloramphenicol resistance-like MFS transporter|nr:MFS transporter [Holosporales bacterium]